MARPWRWMMGRRGMLAQRWISAVGSKTAPHQSKSPRYSVVHLKMWIATKRKYIEHIKLNEANNANQTQNTPSKFKINQHKFSQCVYLQLSNLIISIHVQQRSSPDNGPVTETFTFRLIILFTPGEPLQVLCQCAGLNSKMLTVSYCLFQLL